MGYERKNGAGSRSGLVTIGGGGARKSNGHWSKLEGSGRHGTDDTLGYDTGDDIEMQPRATITTGIVVANQDVLEYGRTTTVSKGSSSSPQVTVTGSKGNDSDVSLLAAHGITCRQTVEVEWTTELVSQPSPVARKGARP